MTSCHATAVPRPSWTLNCTAIWVLLSAWFVSGGIALSWFAQLNRTGGILLLVVGLVGAIFGYHKLNGRLWPLKELRWHRYKKPFPLIYLFCAGAALVGGALHAPTNYDAFTYRIPRLLHWLSEGHWHWIGGRDPRMDFSAAGFEWLMLPTLAALYTLRFAFLINLICYLLLPGLVFSVFSALGVKRSIAATWMWILPCASCFVMQAGSIGNDLIATVYVLAALLFAMRAIQSGKPSEVILSISSAALMTGAKASNLPLLLPIAICLVVVFCRHPKLIPIAVLAGVVASVISFAPFAVANFRHTGDWAGAPDSLLKIEEPALGLAGNSLMIVSASLAPAVFPPADKVNNWFNTKLAYPPLRQIRDGFADFRFTHPQLASEENSGLGLGVGAALLLGMLGTIKQVRARRIFNLGGAVCASFWIALLVYMIKLGNCGAPRLIAPYYSGLIALPLLAIPSAEVFKRPWWRWCSFVLLLPIIPALILNPARPLLPMLDVIGHLKASGLSNGMLNRMEVVYEVYANRSDAHRKVRELLPDHVKSIGFAGTGDESQYSFWLPLGERRIKELAPTAVGMPDVGGVDAIVTSEWGCNDRFGLTPVQLAAKIGWQITGTARVRNYASLEAATWSVLCPLKTVELPK